MSHLPADVSNTEKDEITSTRFQHLTKNDLLLVRSYEPDFMAEVDRAFLAKRTMHLEINGYESNQDIISACLWYALDHGLKVVVISVEKGRERNVDRHAAVRNCS